MSAMEVATNKLHDIASAAYQVFRVPRTLVSRILGYFGLRSVSYESSRSIDLTRCKMTIPTSAENKYRNLLANFKNQLSDELKNDLLRNIFNISIIKPGQVTNDEQAKTYLRGLLEKLDSIGKLADNAWLREHPTASRNELKASRKFISRSLDALDTFSFELNDTEVIIGDAYNAYRNYSTAVERLNVIDEISDFSAFTSATEIQHMLETRLQKAQEAQDKYKSIIEGDKYISAVNLRKSMRVFVEQIKNVDELLKQINYSSDE